MTEIKTQPSTFQQLWETIKSDNAAFLARLTPLAPPMPGLYTYPFTRHGKRARIHLRIETHGAGVLFLDVTDVIHLNPTAAKMAKMALDGLSLPVARARLRSQHRHVSWPQLEADLGVMYEMVGRLRTLEDGCPTCEVSPALQFAPLFSIPVSAPYKADLALTYGCNNQCLHCYNEPDRFAMPSLLAEDWFQVLDKLAAVGVPHLILTGGEATLHPGLPEIIHYADSLGMVVGLNTNGRKLAHRPYMQELADAGLNHLQITLGSCYPEAHNAMMGAASFQQTVKGIESALSTECYVITNTTLMRGNMEYAEEIVSFLYDLGIRTFAMNGMIYSGGGFAHPDAISESEMQPLLVRVRDQAEALGMRFLWYTPTEYCRLSPLELEIGIKRCNAGEYSLCVEPNGDVLPCQSYYVSAGNILHDPWEQIWTSELMRSFRDRELNPEQTGLPEKCWTCPDLPLCGGGCRIEREARRGVKSADDMGGGCSGCSGKTSSAQRDNAIEWIEMEGFIPHGTTVKTIKRSTGSKPPDIQAENGDQGGDQLP